jgi:hypothetical protein
MSAGTNTYKVIFSYDDPSSTPEHRATASGTVKISHVKDDEHARRIFKLKHADRYKNAKVTRVTQVKSGGWDEAANKVVADLLSEGKSDATLTNDANFVVDRLRRTSNNGVSLADEIVNDNDQESAKQHLLTLFDEEEHNALPGFHNLFSNMESGDMEVVAEKAAAILFSND